MMKKINFTLIFKPEPKGGFTVIVPSLPGCVTYGKSLTQAKKMALDAIKGYLISLKKHNELVPSDNSTFFTTVSFEESRKGSYLYA